MSRGPIASALALLMLSALLMASMPAGAQQHGSSLLNTEDDIEVVEPGARANHVAAPTAGHVIISDWATLQNPTGNPIDYGIIYIPPSFTLVDGSPLVLYYSRDYTVVNYTLVLTNVTAGFTMAVPGLTGMNYSLLSSKVGPDNASAPHPRANATYAWHVVVVDPHGVNVTSVDGGNVTPGEGVDTIFRLGPLGLPTIGHHTEEATRDELTNMTLGAYLQPHELLVPGFFRFRIQGMTFPPGVNLTVELRYTGEIKDDGSLDMRELLFTERPVYLSVFVKGDLQVSLYSPVGTVEMPVTPNHVAKDEGTGTTEFIFSTMTSFHLVISPKVHEKGTDWGMVARWAVLVVAIGIIVSIILYPGRKVRGGATPIDEGEEPAGPDPEDEDDEDEAPEEPAPEDELARLEAKRAAKVREMREQYAKGERGEIPKDDVEKLGDRARADVKRLDQRIKELKREQAR
jgi:hypothetical protein